LKIPLSRRGIFPISEIRTYLSLKRIYRQEQPELVHHHTIKPNIYGSFAARSCGVRSVVNSITGLGYIFLSREPFAEALQPLTIFLYRKAIADERVRIIFENEVDQAYFLKKKVVAEEQYSLIQGVGVDLDRFNFSEEPDGPIFIFLPARMLWDKGVGDFVNAASVITKKCADVYFVLVGDTDLGNPSYITRSQLNEWADQEHIEWWSHRLDMPDV
jgi:glycosyltransferase involved in cell wall biosynthesis